MDDVLFISDLSNGDIADDLERLLTTLVSITVTFWGPFRTCISGLDEARHFKFDYRPIFWRGKYYGCGCPKRGRGWGRVTRLNFDECVSILKMLRDSDIVTIEARPIGNLMWPVEWPYCQW